MKIFYFLLFIILCSSVLAIEYPINTTIYTFDKCVGIINVSLINSSSYVDNNEYKLQGCINIANNVWTCECYENYKLILNTQVNTVNTYNFNISYVSATENTTIANSENVTVTQDNTNILIPKGQPIENVIINSNIDSDVPVTLDLSLNTQTNSSETYIELPNDLTLTRNTDDINYSVVLATGTTISGPANWSGVINVPTIIVTTTQPTGASGMTTTVGQTIEVGFGDVKLTFDKAARLVIEGQANKLVGYSRSEIFYKIDDICSDDTQATNDMLPVEGDCRINVGDDLVIWTKHFTEFTTYTETVTPTSSSHRYTVIVKPIILNTTNTTTDVNTTTIGSNNSEQSNIVIANNVTIITNDTIQNNNQTVQDSIPIVTKHNWFVQFWINIWNWFLGK